MRVLEELEPKEVFRYFEEICSIPHGSYQVEKISDYLVSFAREKRLRFRQDAQYNVIIWKDASKGYEDAAPVIVQGHMDMVAVKEEDCEKDMRTEGLDLEVRDGKISARGTSLGGDDGIAVAYLLALLNDDGLEHPPLEAVFTVQEEVGMLGADALDVSDLKGRTFVNLDSETEGIFTVGCAGGVTVTCILPCETEEVMLPTLSFHLGGCAGGHSGVEIHREGANACVLAGRILLALAELDGMRIVSVSGGEKDNAIAASAGAEVALPKEQLSRAETMIRRIFEEERSEYSFSDPDLILTLEERGAQRRSVFTKRAGTCAAALLNGVPNGVQRRNPQKRDMVQTSLNLGILRTDADGVRLTFAVRSSSKSEKDYLAARLTALAEALGGRAERSGDYPGWEYRADSHLRDVMTEVYRKQYGSDPVVEGVHAGLECGIFASRLPGLDAVSVGPQINGIHTTQEELDIASVKRTWHLLLGTLQALK